MDNSLKSRPPPVSSDRGKQMNGPGMFRPTKIKKKEEPPPSYKKQNQKITEDGYIGLDVAPAPLHLDNVARASNGAWMKEIEFEKAFRSGCRRSSGRKKIGLYLGPDEALKLLRECRSLQMASPFDYNDNSIHGVVFPSPPSSLKPEDELLFRSDLDIAWCRGSGCFCPKSGSINKGAWRDEKMKEDYVPFNHHLKMLPFVAAPPSGVSDQDVAIVDKFMIDNLDTGAMKEWNWSLGFPTVVSSMMVVRRMAASKCGKFLEEKVRLVTDLRFANGASDNEDIVLPSHVSFSQSLSEKCLVSKQDAKSGFHQIKADESQHHMLAVYWRGRIFYYTCMAFGIRNAPAQFTKRMQTAASETKAVLAEQGIPLPIADGVYVDDFFQGWRKGQEASVDPFTRCLVDRGIVLGKNKCLPPESSQDILGLEVDAERRMLFVSERKIIASKLEAQSLITDSSKNSERHVDTLRLAQFLGRLNAMEPALPNSLLIIRPLFEDLKMALSPNSEEPFEIDHLNKPRDAEKYAWNVVPLTLSQISIEALEYFLEEVDSMNGQSFDPPVETLLVSWDASSYAAGARVFIVKNGGYELLFTLDGAYFEQAWMGYSSMAREAIALLLVVKELSIRFPKILRNAVIRGVTDNQGLACRYWKGSTALEVNISLIELVKLLRKFGALLYTLVWLPRDLLQVEDDLSKPEGLTPAQVICQEWFDSWMSSLPLDDRPNVDAFADHSNAKLPTYAIIKNNIETASPKVNVLFDGVSVKWLTHQVVWMFPPNIENIIKKAVKNWAESSSQLVYVVLAFKSAERCVRYLEELSASLSLTLTVLKEKGSNEILHPLVITASKNNKVWKQQIFSMRKS